MNVFSQSWLSLGLVCLWAGNLFADSWLPARRFEAISENGKFLVQIVPKKEHTNAHAIVYSVRRDGRREVWRTELVNRVSPVQAFLTDDGTALVTFDNHGRIGYGEDVVAVYGPKGLLSKYSLEQIAPPSTPPQSGNEAERIERSILGHDSYRRKFSHSVSSRHWRANSRQRFIRDDGRLLFCVWLDWDDRWVAWNMADGALMNVTPRSIELLNLLEREKAVEEIRSGKGYSGAHYFLGRTRFKEDRPFVEEWLKDTTFGTGSIQAEASFTYTSASHKRKEADFILARWDGLIRHEPPLSHDNYFFLGTIRGQVRLPQEQQKHGILRIYLVPTETPLESWAEHQPQQYLIANLTHGPYRFENNKRVSIDIGETVNFMICGVTPGRYRVKAVWDRAEPLCDSEAVLCEPAAGDYVSVSSSVFEAKKGIATEEVRVDCIQLVQ